MSHVQTISTMTDNNHNNPQNNNTSGETSGIFNQHQQSRNDHFATGMNSNLSILDSDSACLII